MRLPGHTGPASAVLAMAASVGLSLGLDLLFTIGHPDLESWLRCAFGRSARPDAFEHLNGILILFWLVHTALTMIGIAAVTSSRPDVLVVLSIGPIIGLAIGLTSQDWSDPNWSQVVAISTIGWLVSDLVAAGYWIRRPSRIQPATESA